MIHLRVFLRRSSPATALALALAWPAGRAAAQPVNAAPIPVDPAPMYVADPFVGAGFAGLMDDPGTGMVRTWPRWFAGASGLVMTRTLPAGSATMEPLAGARLSTADAGASWSGGVDLHVGRWFGMRQQHAVELVYWGVYGIGGDASRFTSGGITAIPQAPGVDVAGVNASAYLDGASGQSISRADVINDVEINWVYSLWDRPEFLPRERGVNLMWLTGFRYFGIGDTLTLTTFSGDDALGGLDLRVATANSIYGAQVGAKFDWRFLPRVRLTVVPKFMIGGNAITNTSSFAGSDGAEANFVGGGDASVHSTLGVFSWLGSVDTGVAWDVTDRWSLWMGYRVVGVGNIAQADGQWPTLVTGPASLSGIDAGSSSIVHGGFAGFQGRY